MKRYGHIIEELRGDEALAERFRVAYRAIPEDRELEYSIHESPDPRAVEYRDIQLLLNKLLLERVPGIETLHAAFIKGALADIWLNRTHR